MARFLLYIPARIKMKKMLGQQEDHNINIKYKEVK